MELCIYVSIRLCIYLSNYLFIYLSNYLSICSILSYPVLSIYLSYLSGWIIIFRRSLGRFFYFKIEIRFTSQEIVNYFYIGQDIYIYIYRWHFHSTHLAGSGRWQTYLGQMVPGRTWHKNASYIPQRYILTCWTDALLLPLTWAGTSNSCATAKEKWRNKH